MRLVRLPPTVRINVAGSEIPPVTTSDGITIGSTIFNEKFLQPGDPLAQLNQFWLNRELQEPSNWYNKIEFVQFEFVKGELELYSIVSNEPLFNSRSIFIHIAAFPYDDFARDDFKVLLDIRTENCMSFLFCSNSIDFSNNS